MSEGVVILGMHRSGTSMVSSLVSRMGCYLEKGKNFEPRPLVLVDDRILRFNGYAWNTFLDIPGAMRISADDRVSMKRFKDVLQANTPWVVKDPRLCLLEPMWEFSKVLYLLVVRHPYASACSLYKAEGVSHERGELLWSVYNYLALKFTKRKPTLLVRYPECLKDPDSFCTDLMTALDIRGLKLRDTPSMMDAAMQHNPSPEDDPKGLQARALWKFFKSHSALQTVKPYDLSDFHL